MRRVGRLAAILSALLLAGCGTDPIGPDAAWIEGTWLFREGGCWPEIVITPATLGYSLEIDLSSDGVARILHDGTLVDRQIFTARNRTIEGYEEPIIIIDFEREVIGTRASFRAIREGDAAMTLSDYGIADGCGYEFIRQD